MAGSCDAAAGARAAGRPRRDGRPGAAELPIARRSAGARPVRPRARRPQSAVEEVGVQRRRDLLRGRRPPRPHRRRSRERSRSTSRSSRPMGTPRGAMFLIAGGPGQGSAHVFDLDSAGHRRRCSGSSSPATRSSRTTTAARARPACSTARASRPRSPPISSAAAATACADRSARGASSTGPPTTPRTSRPCARRSASTRSRSSASRTGRSWRWPTPCAHPTTSSG